jgi:hypothetical protein
MPYENGVFTRVDNSFSNPAIGTVISPTDAVELFDEYDAALSAQRKRLTEDTTFFVRTDGSDSNDGLANTAGGAFLTPQKAADVIINEVDTNGFAVTIVLTGAYTTSMAFAGPIVGDGTITVTTLTTASITVTSGHCISASGGARVTVSGAITLSTVTSGMCIFAYDGGTVTTGAGLIFSAAATGHIAAGWPGLTGFAGPGTVFINGNYNITGGAGSHWHATTEGASIIIATGTTVTLTGTPAFSNFFIGITKGQVQSNGLTFSGSATGPKYLIHNGGIFNSAVARSAIPGDVAGKVASGGVFNDQTSTEDSDLGAETIIGYGALTLKYNGASSGGTIGATLDASGKWAFGSQIPTGTNAPLLDVNQTSTVKAGPETSGLRVLNSAAGANVLAEAYGGSGGSFSGFSASGTVGTPTALASGGFIASLRGLAWDGAAWGNAGASAALFSVVASETQSVGNHGNQMEWGVTANATATRVTQMRLQNDGKLNLIEGSLLNNGTAPTGTGAYVRGTTPTIATPVLNGTPTGTMVLPIGMGGTGIATGAGFVLSAVATAVNFNSANTDTELTITLPTGFTRFIVNRLYIFGASGTLSTSTVGLFTNTGGAGTTIQANTANTITTASDGTTNNIMNTAIAFVGSFVSASLPVPNKLYFRVGTAQGVAATANVILIYVPLP